MSYQLCVTQEDATNCPHNNHCINIYWELLRAHYNCSSQMIKKSREILSNCLDTAMRRNISALEKINDQIADTKCRKIVKSPNLVRSITRVKIIPRSDNTGDDVKTSPSAMDIKKTADKENIHRKNTPSISALIPQVFSHINDNKINSETQIITISDDEEELSILSKPLVNDSSNKHTSEETTILPRHLVGDQMNYSLFDIPPCSDEFIEKSEDFAFIENNIAPKKNIRSPTLKTPTHLSPKKELKFSNTPMIKSPKRESRSPKTTTGTIITAKTSRTKTPPKTGIPKISPPKYTTTDEKTHKKPTTSYSSATPEGFWEPFFSPTQN